MSVGSDSSNPKSYELDVLTIVNNEGDGFDIRNIMLECNIYESINRNFLLGELVLGDSVSFLENSKLFGQESLRIKFSQPSGMNDETHIDDSIDQLFRIYKIEAVQRVDGGTQIFKVLFCSPEMLSSKRIRISQAFRGSMTDIAARVARDHLDISDMLGLAAFERLVKMMHRPYWEVREKSQGDNYHVVIPNWTVGYTINWLCKQAQGIDENSGLQDSFFWYQTANGGYRIQSLASMMEINYAGGRPFEYKQANAMDGSDGPYDKTDVQASGVGRRILAFEVDTHADVLKAVIEGLFASKQTTIDNTYKFFTEKTYNFLEKHFSGGSSIEEHPFIRTQPEVLHIGSAAQEGVDVRIEGSRTEDKAITDYPNAHQILASDSSFVMDAEDKIHQANHFTHLGSSQLRTAAKQLLDYYTINVAISARTDISVGQLINLDIPLPDMSGEAEIPKFYNGKHLITEIMWNLTPRECNVSLKCIKDSVINNIETTEINYGGIE